VQAFTVSGADAAENGQSIRPGSAVSPDLVGNFQDLTITAHDAIFGTATGDVALVTMPDHSVWRVPLGPQHTVRLDDMPQGYFRASVAAGHAIVFAKGFTLTRTTSIDLTVLSAADLALIGGTLALVLAGLVLVSPRRRTWLRNALRYRRKEVSSA
jgi:hypothetical protein